MSHMNNNYSFRKTKKGWSEMCLNKVQDESLCTFCDKFEKWVALLIFLIHPICLCLKHNFHRYFN